ncbi:hypothetical protein [Iningainema tapete]|uniref:Uncharacterized protein n=1 Tax=Iningainema tapete BLCC-T55 TaxID=2748662 RepID=A0A8J7BZL9_9CYAN|nr:hypothetical protein [Iningainema tapete]MBD2776178.1 hypothetical protein [Iningainema tapete BLCC-T55]
MIGAIFVALALVRLKSLKHGLLIFLQSVFVSLLGSSAGYFIGWLWYKLTVITEPSFSNPRLSGIATGMMAAYLSVIWDFCIYIGTILGAIWGGISGLKYYKLRGKRD